MENYLKKAMGIIWSPLFIMPFLFILMWNYRAFIENEDMSLDSEFIVFKSGLVKFVLICLDSLIIYTFYTYLKGKSQERKKANRNK